MTARRRLTRARIDNAAAAAAAHGGRLTIGPDGAIEIVFDGETRAASEEGEALQAKIDEALGVGAIGAPRDRSAGAKKVQ
ncbi:MAG: hypothetical protein GC206_11880 [Alphaproteobacteria bacterium]|nr:hypothetical protein [Alphaproteobacteria bacterium]